MPNASVYALIDPRTSEMRYVGFSRDVLRRVRDHLTLSDRTNTHRAHWLKSLRDVGLRPEVEVIETVERDAVKDAERFWIAYFRAMGCPLTNLTVGGDGNYGWQMPEDVKRKIGAKSAGRVVSQTTRSRMSDAHRGRKVVHRDEEAWRRHLSAAKMGQPRTRGFTGRTHTLDSRQRMSASISAGQTRRWARIRAEREAQM